MSKKIKALVQKYEKDMQFENRFDDLKHKLDLIPDAEVKSEVFTIKRKVMPAYVMMVVLLMLVTGIIGLQFGLNGDLNENQPSLNPVDIQLMEEFDIYNRESVKSIVINSNIIIYLYVGYKGVDKKLMVRVEAKGFYITMQGTANNNEFYQATNSSFVVASIEDEIVEIDLSFYDNSVYVTTINQTVDFSSHFDWLMD
ncbi:hypothetical protein N7548_07290 [Acholeplasma manati]|uniref:DUF3379 domain-containing protein n=1 Tax=Paracholeplasma manati TaxID=591373 RepID=A0ABT2Y999_9MOLU|nr:hypothetical protein [Paracholeplasma manati]MCV2232620.1 hypothetical protein [Paracholeplasma manati]